MRLDSSRTCLVSMPCIANDNDNGYDFGNYGEDEDEFEESELIHPLCEE